MINKHIIFIEEILQHEKGRIPLKEVHSNAIVKATRMHAVPLLLATLLITLIICIPVSADTPEVNDIPTLAMRIKGSHASFIEDFSLELLCELSWMGFDAVNFGGRASKDYVTNLMGLCDSTGLYYSFCASEIMQYLAEWSDSSYRYWFRNSSCAITSDSAFAQCDSTYSTMIDYMPADSMYSENDTISIAETLHALALSIDEYASLWFYEVYDEANSQQGRHGANYGSSYTYDDYLPNVYTQDYDSSGLQPIPTLGEVEASGIFSIQKYYAEHDTTRAVPFTMNFALIHFIDKDDYTGLTEDRGWATMETQARCVRALMEAEYQPPPNSNGILPSPLDNSPDFIMFDYYPFRYVHPDSGDAEMCDSDWLFLVEHFEEGIDSTVIPAHEYDCPVFYFPQTFGVAGGPVIWDETADPPEMDYPSYAHRKPAPQELRMLCNLALLHQAKGIFPYNLCSYTEDSDRRIMSSLLDLHNIPFDAPYEDWRYTGRWPADSLQYIRPDSIPPWIDGYDPLYTLSPPPDTSGDGQRASENWYAWHFTPYADLYNSLYDILAEVKRIGPEMHDLWWSEESGTPYWDVAEIVMPDSDLLDNYVPPVIRVFQSDDSDNAYLYYVNRYCGEHYTGGTDSIPVIVRIHDTECPGDVYRRALDHHRRYLLPVDKGLQDLYYYSDTLEAGQGRLVEFVDTAQSIQADLRITSPDVFSYPSGYEGRSHEHVYTAGTAICLGGTYYNMGTDSTGNVEVTFIDRTDGDSILLGRDTVDLEGLSGCFQPDSSSAIICWNTDSVDIGVHVIEIEADSISGEEYHDNSVMVTVLLKPRDYASAVRQDAWDMDDDTTSDWYTSDIEAVRFRWDTTSAGWTDSVSGMFEGVMEYDTLLDEYRAEISLAIPSSPSRYLDTDIYHMLSLGIVGHNPYEHPGGAFGVHINWKDSSGVSSGWKNLLGSEWSIANGWDAYATVGPIDLDSVPDLGWGSGSASELWLRFVVGPPPSEPYLPIDVRIGWIRLEESVQ